LVLKGLTFTVENFKIHTVLSGNTVTERVKLVLKADSVRSESRSCRGRTFSRGTKV